MSWLPKFAVLPGSISSAFDDGGYRARWFVIEWRGLLIEIVIGRRDRGGAADGWERV